MLHHREALLIAISLLVPAHAVLAQAFPGKLVRVIIPFPTGSSTDAQARILGPLLSERWKQQVIVDSRPGATTIIGTDLVAKSPPDGHTLLFTSIQFAYVPALFAKLPYDPRTDLVPVTIVSFSPEAIVAHPSLPAKNVRELVALARARPLNMGTPGNELTTRYFNTMAKVNITPVSYKGGAPLMIDVAGGHVELGIAGTITLQAIIRPGRVRLLGIASTTPSLIFPDAPLIPKECPASRSSPGGASSRPPTRPASSCRGYATTSRQCCRCRMSGSGCSTSAASRAAKTVDQFTARVRSEIARWQQVATAAGIKRQ
jgi:tripartite-type tricarboxylate transporter receptor subunit TctC